MKKINKLSADLERTGTDALVKGYQRILLSRVTSGPNKGAFSIFAMTQGYSFSDNSQTYQYVRTLTKDTDSVWLTAYVVKCLAFLKQFIAVNDYYLREAMDFLVKKQTGTGQFAEYGPIYYYTIQSESTHGIPLTAFTVIALSLIHI